MLHLLLDPFTSASHFSCLPLNQSHKKSSVCTDVSLQAAIPTEGGKTSCKHRYESTEQSSGRPQHQQHWQRALTHSPLSSCPLSLLRAGSCKTAAASPSTWKSRDSPAVSSWAKRPGNGAEPVMGVKENAHFSSPVQRYLGETEKREVQRQQNNPASPGESGEDPSRDPCCSCATAPTKAAVFQLEMSVFLPCFKNQHLKWGWKCAVSNSDLEKTQFYNDITRQKITPTLSNTSWWIQRLTAAISP